MRLSTKTGVAPRRAKALAVETKVKEGMITSSPGPTPDSIPAISSACVHDVVSMTVWAPVIDFSCSSQAWTNRPPPVSEPLCTTWVRLAISWPVGHGLENGMIGRFAVLPRLALPLTGVLLLSRCPGGALVAVGTPFEQREQVFAVAAIDQRMSQLLELFVADPAFAPGDLLDA